MGIFADEPHKNIDFLEKLKMNLRNRIPLTRAKIAVRDGILLRNIKLFQ